jgi:large repetitive protein
VPNNDRRSALSGACGATAALFGSCAVGTWQAATVPDAAIPVWPSYAFAGVTVITLYLCFTFLPPDDPLSQGDASPSATSAGAHTRRADGRRLPRTVLVMAGALAIGIAIAVYVLPSQIPLLAGSCASSPPSSPGGPAVAGSWGLASAQGTTVSDASGQHPATETNLSWKDGHGGAYFNGFDSQVSTQGQVLDTGPKASFTISAWACLTSAVPFSATAVSQDNNEGSKISGFYLQYAGQANRSWSFTRSSKNTGAAAGIDALSASPAALNTWVHLVGVYDADDGQLRLYVNGLLQGTKTDKTPFNSNGSLVIGRAEFGGDYVDWFPGYISDVEVFQQALTTNQVKAI